LFATYADEDAPDSIGIEGFERLCKDAEMSLEGARPLIFSWQLQAKEMGRITKDEWLQGMATLK
jgi:DCN1-like protein 4/5